MKFSDPDLCQFVLKALTEHGLSLTIGKDRDRSWSAGRDIMLGTYEDEELAAISFAHEVVHMLVTQEFKESVVFNTMIIELEAWHAGLDYARRCGIVFKDHAIAWGMGQLLTYKGHDEREGRGWSFRRRPGANK